MILFKYVHFMLITCGSSMDLLMCRPIILETYLAAITLWLQLELDADLTG